MKGITDIAGIRVGHAADREARTGCTAILFDRGAVAGVDVRGSATGTEELGLLDPMHVTERIDALVFAGGSAFGLEAVSGVRRALGKKGVGVSTPGGPVPLVAGAILYDLSFAERGVHPTREMGEAAVAAASDGPVMEGNAGAGMGATVGKLFGMGRAMKGGVGTYTVDLGGGLLMSALAAVNAFGDIVDPASGNILAGARTAAGSRQFANTAAAMKGGASASLVRQNTTLVAVATNARLTKVEVRKLAESGSAGMARAIAPCWTTNDGDLTVGLATGTHPPADLNILGVAAAEAVTHAILRGVLRAGSLNGVPGLGS